MFISAFNKTAAMTAIAAAGVFFAQAAQAEVKLPKVFGSNMVLQQEAPVKIWGWADPGEAVSASFGDAKAEAKATSKGEWKLELPAQKASATPAKLTVKGSNEIVLDNVLVGEVWLCSGQSNMEQGVNMSADKETEVPAADNPNIRLFMIPNKFTAAPQKDVDAQWKVCTPATLAEGGWNGFSAAGYYFGKELNKTLNVPVGLIEADWGGTRIEPWTSPEGFAQVPALADLYGKVLLADLSSKEHKERVDQLVKELDAWQEAAKKARDEEKPVPQFPAFPAEFITQGNQQTPAWLYNAMLAPIVPFQIRGAIWYQGESNHGEGMLYVEKTKALVASWRQIWENPKLSYYFVQIAPFQYGGESPFIEPEFWEAQYAITKAVPGSGIVGTTDIGDLKDIHPKNKKEVGRRLALQALQKTYGKKDVVADSPAFNSFKADGSKLIVSFDNVPTGLKTRDGKAVNWFEIIDADKGGFVEAKAEISGKTVVLSADGVEKPVAVRFGWSKLAEPNLVSEEGLPAYPFRAGDVPKRDALVLIPDSKGYELVYQIDLGKLPNVVYEIDNSAKLKPSFDRIAYMLELTKGGEMEYLYVSMDAFTDDLKKIGVPTAASGASFQQLLSNLTVYSNAKDIKTGSGLKGNIEFWPNNYAPGNAKNVPNASASNYDFGDQLTQPLDGYGSMQIHNYDAKQTLFAVNNWKAGQSADIGIGNRPGQPNSDWTFANNAKEYTVKTLKVLVHPK